MTAPHRENAPTVAAVEASEGQESSERPDSATAEPQPQPDAAHALDRKALATLRARAALLGLTLHPLPDGGALICRAAWSRELATLAEAGSFLDRWEGRP